MPKKVKIEGLYSWGGKGFDQFQFTRVTVDGEELILESYGGEPEDNSRFRDYRWVEEALQKLAEKLGAEVERTERELSEAEAKPFVFPLSHDLE